MLLAVLLGVSAITAALAIILLFGGQSTAAQEADDRALAGDIACITRDMRRARRGYNRRRRRGA